MPTINDQKIYEIRARTRTLSTDSMTSENIQLLQSEQHNKHLDLKMDSAPRRLGLLQVFLLNAVVCGVEICACSGFTYIPPMLLKSGYTEENMSIILGLGPLLGFFIVPLIGRASDRCRSGYGRRRPFILVISVILIISLIIIPYGDILSNYLFGNEMVAKSFSLLFLTIGVVLLDFTSQACLTPCEALLSDSSKDTDQHERVFIIYSLMVSLGGFIGYLITALDWNSFSIGAYFKTQERTVFTILIVLFTLLLSATLMVADEKPLNKLESEPIQTAVPKKSTATLLTIGNGGVESGYDTSGSESGNGHIPSNRADVKSSQNSFRSKAFSFMKFPKVCIRLVLTCRFCSSILNLLRLLWISIHEKLPEPLQKLCDIPVVLRHLAFAHFCSWTAIMGFNLFFTDFVGNSVYKGNPNAPEDSDLRNRFDEGVRMGSWGLLLHCITSAVYAFFVERLVNRYGCKLTYTVGMVSFSVAMFGMVFFQNIVFVNAMAAFTGFGYATVTTIPFILVSKYHNEKEVYFYDVVPQAGTNQIQVRGIATDMATLDSAYFLSQVVLSCIMGYIVYMTGTVLSYMVTAGVMGVLSCFFIQNVISSKQDIMHHRQLQSNLNC